MTCATIVELPAASPDQDFLKLLDDFQRAIESWPNKPRLSPQRLAGVDAARQSLVDYVAEIRARAPADSKEETQRIGPETGCCYCSGFDGFHEENCNRPSSLSPTTSVSPDVKKLLDAWQNAAHELDLFNAHEQYELDRPAADKLNAEFNAARSSIEAAFVALSERLEIESRRVEEWIEREAKLCPEDFGIEEYVHSLEKQLSALSEERDRLRAELMHLKLESARERVAPLVEEAKLAASKERRP